MKRALVLWFRQPSSFPVTRFSWILLVLFMCLELNMVRESGKLQLEENVLRNMEGNEKGF